MHLSVCGWVATGAGWAYQKSVMRYKSSVFAEIKKNKWKLCISYYLLYKCRTGRCWVDKTLLYIYIRSAMLHHYKCSIRSGNYFDGWYKMILGKVSFDFILYLSHYYRWIWSKYYIRTYVREVYETIEDIWYWLIMLRKSAIIITIPGLFWFYLQTCQPLKIYYIRCA